MYGYDNDDRDSSSSDTDSSSDASPSLTVQTRDGRNSEDSDVWSDTESLVPYDLGDEDPQSLVEKDDPLAPRVRAPRMQYGFFFFPFSLIPRIVSFIAAFSSFRCSFGHFSFISLSFCLYELYQSIFYRLFFFSGFSFRFLGDIIDGLRNTKDVNVFEAAIGEARAVIEKNRENIGNESLVH